MKVKAIVMVTDKRTFNGYNTISKVFDVEVRDEGRLYSMDLVKWIESKKNRVSNTFTIVTDFGVYKYSL